MKYLILIVLFLNCSNPVETETEIEENSSLSSDDTTTFFYSPPVEPIPKGELIIVE